MTQGHRYGTISEVPRPEDDRHTSRTWLKGRVLCDDPVLAAVAEVRRRHGVSEAYLVREGVREIIRRRYGLKIGEYPHRDHGRRVMDGGAGNVLRSSQSRPARAKGEGRRPASRPGTTRPVA